MKKFNVLGRHTFKGSDKQTEHIIGRDSRLQQYYDEFGKGEWVHTFVVDKGHENGKEFHVLKNNRLIEVYNFRTKKIITILYARPAQLKRYYGKYRFPEHLYDDYVEGYNNL